MSFISYKEAIKRLHDSLQDQTLTKERVFLSSAIDRVLAEDIVAYENSPAFATSAMDGYAIMYKDQELKRLKISDEIPAGSVKDIELQSKECVKTFTGSLMCSGSDTLIPIENVELDGDEIIIKEPVSCGFAVREIGENYKKDELLIKQETKIGFAEIAVMASLNISQVSVYKKPEVAIISTGSEILDIGQKRVNSSQIRSSNHITLEILAKKAGATTTRSPLLKDNKHEIKQTILNFLHDSDIVVTTGGVSVGDYDFIRDILKEIDGEYILDGVFMKPGQHIKIVKIGRKYICALPGFAYSSVVTFMLFVEPIIKKMQGLSPDRDIFRAILKDDFYKKTDKTEFTAVNLNYHAGKFYVDLKDKKFGSSAILTNMLGNVALMKTTGESKKIKKGEEIDILLINN